MNILTINNIPEGKTMKNLTAHLIAILALSALPGAYANDKDHANETRANAAAEPSASELAEGEVRKIDKSAGKITLKHGEIKSLEMPGMTMVFRVKDPAMLDKLQAGDKIRFKAERSNGALFVTEMQLVK